jgi:glycerol uptake facilitator-like aquaporin
MFSRNKVARLVAEFLGAGLLTLVIISVQRSTIGVPYFVGLAAGLAAAVLIMVFGRASGAHLNPAVTVALWTARQVRTASALLYIVVQLLGGYLAGQLYQYLINNDVSAVSHTFAWRVLVAEAVGAMILGLGWAAATFHVYSETKKAALVGAAYVVGIIAASAASVGIVNPAVALGANAWTWTYGLGPVLGAVIGVNLFGLLFAPAVGRVAGTANANANATVPATTTTTSKEVAPENVSKSTAAKKLASKPTSTKKAEKKTDRKKSTTRKK